MSIITVVPPRVFISYAWGDDDYQRKVLAFATSLIEDGVDVELDQWALKEGHDKYAYMEQSVTDPTITNVLMLLNEKYAEKANERSGGVGTETQIISAEIYNKVKQEKFLPVIFERGQNGEVFKPAYLKGVLHFDLSKASTYDYEYQRLVRRLYGIELVKKPDLGNQPLWLEREEVASPKQIVSYELLDGMLPSARRSDLFISYLDDAETQLYALENEMTDSEKSNYISVYDHFIPIRDCFLELLQHVSSIDDGVHLFIESLSNIRIKYCRNGTVFSDVIQCLTHELFIYTIGFLYKKYKYSDLAYLFNRTYIMDEYISEHSGLTFNAFRRHGDAFDTAICNRDEKQYLSGIAKYWTDHINTRVCSKSDFVFADILCFNASVLCREYNDDWYWFPTSYIYQESGRFRVFAVSLQSKERLILVATMFGYQTLQEFVDKAKELEQSNVLRDLRNYRYRSTFEHAPFILQFTNSDNLGIRP